MSSRPQDLSLPATPTQLLTFYIFIILPSPIDPQQRCRALLRLKKNFSNKSTYIYAKPPPPLTTTSPHYKRISTTYQRHLQQKMPLSSLKALLDTSLRISTVWSLCTNLRKSTSLSSILSFILILTIAHSFSRNILSELLTDAEYVFRSH